MPFPISKSNLSANERLLFDYATNPNSSTMERVRMAILLAEAQAAAQGYVFKWEYRIQEGWSVTVYLEPDDLGRPVFIAEETHISLNHKLDREEAQRLEEARIILSLMSPGTLAKVMT